MKKITTVFIIALLLLTGCRTTESGDTSDIDKAVALITTFETGDIATARSLLSDGYIQHNLDYATGPDAFVAAVEGLAAAPVKTTVENIRAFQDGEYVFLQNKYNFAGGGDMAAFDIFRFEDGKIAEHWDNLSAVTPPNPSGHTQFDGETEIRNADKTEENKEVVRGFVYDVLMGNNPSAITDYISSEEYIQHNSGIADGLDGLSEALAAYAEAGIEMIYDVNHMVLGQGNFVLSVSEGSLGGVHSAYYDLFRVEGGKIVEHWDVIAEIPAEETWANANGKF